MNIRSVETELLHANCHRDRHDEDDSCFLQDRENAPKKGQTSLLEKSKENHNVKTVIIMTDIAMIMAMMTVTATWNVMIIIEEKLQ